MNKYDFLESLPEKIRMPVESLYAVRRWVSSKYPGGPMGTYIIESVGSHTQNVCKGILSWPLDELIINTAYLTAAMHDLGEQGMLSDRVVIDKLPSDTEAQSEIKIVRSILNEPNFWRMWKAFWNSEQYFKGDDKKKSMVNDASVCVVFEDMIQGATVFHSAMVTMICNEFSDVAFLYPPSAYLYLFKSYKQYIEKLNSLSQISSQVKVVAAETMIKARDNIVNQWSSVPTNIIPDYLRNALGQIVVK